MTNKEPVAEPIRTTEEATAIPWEETYERLSHGSTHWLATVRPDGRPHVVPVGAVGFEGAFYFTSGQGTRKRWNLAHNPHCVISTSNDGYDLVVEGDVAPVREEALLERLAAVYSAQGWPATAVAGAFDAPFSAPTTGPAPYDVYEVTPTLAFALGTTEETVERCTRYRF